MSVSKGQGMYMLEGRGISESPINNTTYYFP